MTSIDRNVHRRAVLLRCLTGAGCLMLAQGAARAQSSSFPKSTKNQAAYLDHAQPELRLCGACNFFLNPDECQVVEGPINAYGTCDYFEE
jgi:hypothetical protein